MNNTVFDLIEQIVRAVAGFVAGNGARIDPSRPHDIDPKDQWYFTTEWQKSERMAEADLKAGRYEDFSDIDQAMRVLLQNAATTQADHLDRVAEALRRAVRPSGGRR